MGWGTCTECGEEPTERSIIAEQIMKREVGMKVQLKIARCHGGTSSVVLDIAAGTPLP